MSNKNVLRQLLFMDARDAEIVIDSAFAEYAQFVADIYNDIYDSCIELYYDSYDPKIYDRHGDPKGFNLYRASDIYANDLMVNLSLEAYNLLPYTGKEKRDRVLGTVLDGLRGAGSRYKNFRGWPRGWNARYPNQFSKYTEWHSSYGTIDGILRDFAKNGIKKTSNVFWDIIGNKI